MYENDSKHAGQLTKEEEIAEQENIGQLILKEEFSSALIELKHKAVGMDNMSEGSGKEEKLIGHETTNGLRQ